MVINTNISSLTAQEAAKNTNNSISSSLEKLSTGLKINKASDDASGLAIADKLRTQVTSINQAVSNGNSAVSLLQIADKSMSEQSTILDTIKAKLIQANTDTTSDDGREAIRKDVVKLLEQLDNIAEQTNYNGNVLLQSSTTSSDSSSALAFQIGESKNDIIENTAIQSNTSGLGGGAEALIDTATTTDAKNNTVGQGATMEFKGDGTAAVTLNSEDDTPAAAVANVTLSGKIGELSSVADLTITNVDTITADYLDNLKANGVAITGDRDAGYGVATGTTIDFGDLNVSKMTVETDTAEDISILSENIVKVTNNDTTSGNTLDIETTGTVTGGDLLSSLSALKEGELSKDMADKFQGVVDNAITDLNGYRGDIGSTQNQVESAVRNLMTASTNVAAAESIIRDVDYAEESANFNKQNIISQAGSYAISQANTVQQNVLKLLQ